MRVRVSRTDTPLSRARLRAGLSQEQAAEALGISKSTWGEWERGEAVPRDIKAAALDVKRVLGITGREAWPDVYKAMQGKKA